MKCLVLGVWCNAQVLCLVRAGLDLVRRRRGPDRCQTTEPSPSTHQKRTSQSRHSSSGAADCVALGLSLVGLIEGSYWDVSRDLINPGWVT